MHSQLPSRSTRRLCLRQLVLGFVLGAASLLSGAEGKLTVTWLNMPVHGLAAVVETPSGKVVLVDTGGVDQKSGKDYNAGRDTISPFLKARGYKEITSILISHPHGDHYGGLEWLLQNWTVGELVDNGYEGRAQTLAYTRLRDLAVQRGGKYRALLSGARPAWDPALDMEILSPPAGFLSAASTPEQVSDHGLLNSNSLLLRIAHGKNVFLFPGDSYGGAFEAYLKKNVPAEKLLTTVLTAPHHGFNPGYDFPAMLMPKFVIASCLPDYASNAGTANPRSPGDRAIEVYGKLGAEVFVTAFNGNVQAVSDGSTVTVTPDHARQKTPPSP